MPSKCRDVSLIRVRRYSSSDPSYHENHFTAARPRASSGFRIFISGTPTP